MRIGRRFRIAPEPSRGLDDGRIELVIGVGAFGSGGHETSSSCVEMLEDLEGVQGARVLDLGSGTGILAIAALRLGAASALCVDIDPRAANVCRANCRANRVENGAYVVAGSMDCIGDAEFDLVLANVYSDVLSTVARSLRSRVAPDARVILSGIPWQDLFDIERLYRCAGFAVLKTIMLDEYCTVVLAPASSRPPTVT
jgi:ribosomal protein L11 methyltransferase